jgi:hypothetical protein
MAYSAPAVIVLGGPIQVLRPYFDPAHAKIGERSHTPLLLNLSFSKPGAGLFFRHGLILKLPGTEEGLRTLRILQRN